MANMMQDGLLRRIAQVEFVCVELNEYLDTHPQDHDAKRDYFCYSQKLRMLMDEYEAQYGPLKNFGHSPTEAGCWVCSKWPWEL